MEKTKFSWELVQISISDFVKKIERVSIHFFISAGTKEISESLTKNQTPEVRVSLSNKQALSYGEMLRS